MDDRFARVAEASPTALVSASQSLEIAEKRIEIPGDLLWVESPSPEPGTTIVFIWKEPTA